MDNLVIVESPAKAKTIEKFLGEGFTVKSSFGHIRDLAKKNLGVDIEHNFEPDYEVPADKKTIVANLRKDVKAAKVVWLASDEDREGEAIAWHLAEELNLANKETKRIVFHEITKKAILSAIATPRTINQSLVDAQQARRILDRLVGFELSPVLWKKIKPSLSAGRVQSVAVRLLVEREREIINFTTSSAFRITAEFEITDEKGKISILKAELPKKFAKADDAKAFLEKCKISEFTVADIAKKPGRKTPAPPFTTSTLQQEASRKLGFSVSQTMMVAQRLYEGGKITYMRTDSVNLSEEALNSAQQEINTAYGTQYHKQRTYTTKTKGAQEAHEAIRPTYFDKHTTSGTAQEQKLYELIWKRTIASQMSEALLEKTTITIDVSKASENFVATGEVIVFDGFLKVYIESTDDDNEEETKELLPALRKGEKLTEKNITATERFANHLPRYTEASLVKKLEDLGIGRPSTYAPTISTIQNRGYVVKESREGEKRDYTVITLKSKKITQKTQSETAGSEKNKLFPTDIGMVVTDFLTENFENILDYNFTANVEKEFDEIANGKIEWRKMMSTFYQSFHPVVEKVLETSERKTGQRELGTDQKTGKPVSVRIGRYGPMVQLGEAASKDSEEKPQFSSLRKDQHLETITLEEALELFKLPRTLGDYESKTVVIGVGRFGPYVRHDSKFVSLKKEDDPLTIELSRAVELIEAKRKADSEKLIKTFAEEPEIQILNGRWGPYIAYKKNNYKITDKEKAAELTLDDCLKIIKEADAKPATGKAKKTTTRKTTKK